MTLGTEAQALRLYMRKNGLAIGRLYQSQLTGARRRLVSVKQLLWWSKVFRYCMNCKTNKRQAVAAGITDQLLFDQTPRYTARCPWCGHRTRRCKATDWYRHKLKPIRADGSDYKRPTRN